LELVATSEDASASERLRALDLLASFERDEAVPFASEVAGIDEDLLVAELADLEAPIGGGVRALSDPESPLARILLDALAPEPRTWVGLGAALRRLIEERAREIAAERTDVKRAEAEIERRASRKAARLAAKKVRELREADAFSAVLSPEGSNTGSSPSEPAAAALAAAGELEAVPERLALPAGLVADDLRRGWGTRRRRRFFEFR
jgi:hypothetical protein